LRSWGKRMWNLRYLLLTTYVGPPICLTHLKFIALIFRKFHQSMNLKILHLQWAIHNLCQFDKKIVHIFLSHTSFLFLYYKKSHTYCYI
jgi:hypothetical protein